MEKLPIYRKAVITPEEASIYGDINIRIIRAFGALAKLGRSDFPGFYCGAHLKIHRELFDEWLADLARGHKNLEMAVVEQMVKEASEPAAKGRPRKNRLNLAR